MTDRERALGYYQYYVDMLESNKRLKVISNEEYMNEMKYIDRWVTEREEENDTRTEV